MSTFGRCLQALCIAAFLVTGVAHAHEARLHPVALERPGRFSASPAWPTGLEPDVPLSTLRAAVAHDLIGSGGGSLLWRERRWYPFLLAPLWLAALLLVAGPSVAAASRRRAVGAGLLAAAVALAAFEAFYLGIEYAPLLPGLLGRAEVVLAWLFVVALLFVRRRADRHLGAVEAHVAAQALLGVAHLLTLPSSQVRVWLGAFPLEAAATAMLTNFRPAFWAGCLLLALSVLPVYLRRLPAPAPDPGGPDGASATTPSPG